MNMRRCGSYKNHGPTTFFAGQSASPIPTTRQWPKKPTVCTMRAGGISDPMNTGAVHDYFIDLTARDFAELANEFASRIKESGIELSQQLSDSSLALKQLAACAEGLILQPIEFEAAENEASVQALEVS